MSKVLAGMSGGVDSRCCEIDDARKTARRIGIPYHVYKSKRPYCTNHLTLTGFNDIATTNPDLISEWDYEKNKHIYPTMYTF